MGLLDVMGVLGGTGDDIGILGCDKWGTGVTWGVLGVLGLRWGYWE